MREPTPLIVHGTAVNARTQCTHWHSERDIIAIKFRCCGEFYACFECHTEQAGHPAQTWPRAEFEAAAIYCGSCCTTLTINAYLASDNQCPACAAAFNPGCAKHYPLYFEM
ncbi:CHY zinc finger protein [Hymenobacter psoromatis]|uniref:CHY zinc finger protein n=1 Tax=Hymenobacter psoromatis TaxID=1484116 RepID=UPI001CBE7893